MRHRHSYRNIRVASAQILAEYLSNTALWRRIGNAAFADFIGRQHVNAVLPSRPAISPFRKDFVVFHSWLPGMYEISSPEAEALIPLISTIEFEEVVENKIEQLVAELSKRGWCDDAAVDLDALVSQAVELFAAIQNPRELRELFALVHALNPEVVLEIGTARGGVLYGLSQLASARALIVSIDLPGGRNCGGQTETERRLFSCFGPPTQEFRFIPEDSTSIACRKALKTILNSRKVDVLFIDGGHSYEVVRSDFEIYGEFVSDRGIIAIHDIRMMPEEWGPDAEVGIFWAELAREYQTREIIDSNGMCKRRCPPGVPWSWGIGIVGKSKRAQRGPDIYARGGLAPK